MAKASKHVQPYSPEFRAEAIRLARTSGKSHREIADDLGMTSETLRFWLKQADLDAGKRHDGLTSEDQEELRRLRRENRILQEEREPSARRRANVQLTADITQIHQQSRGTYGALRVQAELKARGLSCGHNRVARLRRQAGLVGCHRRRPVHVRTTRRDPAATPAPDLVQRRFTAPGPDRLWIADSTSLPTEQEGFLVLSVILEVFSRRVVGWSMQDHLRTELVLAALEMAVRKRRPEAGLIHHSDQGCQYTSVRFGERCAAAGHPPLDGDRRRLF